MTQDPMEGSTSPNILVQTLKTSTVTDTSFRSSLAFARGNLGLAFPLTLRALGASR
jgi:hypothetical protein